MRFLFQLLSRVVLIMTLLIWLVGGHNRGWTKTSVPVKTTDPVTGIEGVTLQKHFVPGVDFLGAGIILASVLGGISLLYKRTPVRA